MFSGTEKNRNTNNSKNKNMSKPVEISPEKILEAASKCSTAAATLKILFPEVFKSANPIDSIGDYNDVCNKLGVSSDDNTIKIEVPGFDSDQIKMVKAVIKKMRVVEVYNGAKKLNKGDRRHYNWYTLSGSGLVFFISGYGVDDAHTSSAARLSFRNNDLLMDFVKKFKYLDEDIIDLR